MSPKFQKCSALKFVRHLLPRDIHNTSDIKTKTYLGGGVVPFAGLYMLFDLFSTIKNMADIIFGINYSGHLFKIYRIFL